jgi:N-terminal domain of galactosyltransferase
MSVGVCPQLSSMYNVSTILVFARIVAHAAHFIRPQSSVEPCTPPCYSVEKLDIIIYVDIYVGYVYWTSFNLFSHRLAYDKIFGGATSFRTEHFELINGFANKFFGWGGEDDDSYQR